jgi:hypothetical protein
MTRAATNVLPFRARPPAPLSDAALVSRLLDLAREADRAGRAHVAGLLVGAAYAMCDDVPPDDGGHRRVA